jgi:UDPglucose--hexose-1-phosphate uridylyltransferase
MPDLRKDPILGRWVIIATERGKRPSDFVTEPSPPGTGFCPLCPGNEDKTPPEVYAIRPSGSSAGDSNWRLRVVPNKFPALTADSPPETVQIGPYERMNGVGRHEVVIETPYHNVKLGDLGRDDVVAVLVAFSERMRSLRDDPRFRYVMVFKNHGIAAGASLEHSHSQLIALPIIPKRVVEEMEGSRRYYREHNRCIFCDMIVWERQEDVRVVEDCDEAIAFAPFASRFPFETWIMPVAHHAAYEDMGDYGAIADVLLGVLRRMDQVLDDPPFNLVLHTSDFGRSDEKTYHWHMEVFPTLTKVAGFEWGSGFYINPTPPEEAVGYLREVMP